jgi:hypothetical protein
MTGSDAAFRVVVPTRDSAKWIGVVLGAYRRLGVRPLFLVDSRSADGTRGILEAEGADLAEVTPEADLVEDMVWRIPSVTDAAWVLRFDDDEMPSHALLDWAASALPRAETDQFALSRRWCLLSREGRLRYSRLEDFYWSEARPDLLDPQSRLFRPDRVRFVRDIHTAGFAPSPAMGFAPAEAFFCHFDWIVRAPPARIAKLRRYERQSPGSGGALFGRFYLPECLNPAELRETAFETDEFEDLARALAATAAAAAR